MAAKQTRIDILRHGLPEGDGCLRGHTDFAITPTGLTQMSAAIADLKQLDVVVTSSLQRCSDFAEQVADRFSVSLERTDGWKEMNFGDWDGKTEDQLWQEQGKVIEQYWQDPWGDKTPHGGETLAEFDRRIEQAWHALLEQHKGKQVLLVTHAGVMRQLLRILLEMPKNATYIQRLKLPFAARYRVTVCHDENGMDWPQIQWPIMQQY